MKEIVISLLVMLIHATAWSKELTLIVPYPPGGFNDILARNIQPGLEKKLNASVVIKNIPGAGNSLALAEMLASGDPDNIFIMTQDDVICGPLFQGKTTYDKLKPVSIIGHSFYIFAGAADATSSQLKFEEQQGHTINVANNGINGSAYLWLKTFRGNLKINPVPYKGIGPQVVVDIKNGSLQYSVFSAINAKQYIDAGLIAPIAVSSEQRLSIYPSAPTFKELGILVPSTSVWFGILARKDASDQRVSMINTYIREIVQNNETIQNMGKNGFIILNLSPIESKSWFMRDIQRFESIKQNLENPGK